METVTDTPRTPAELRERWHQLSTRSAAKLSDEETSWIAAFRRLGLDDPQRAGIHITTSSAWSEDDMRAWRYLRYYDLARARGQLRGLDQEDRGRSLESAGYVDANGRVVSAGGFSTVEGCLEKNPIKPEFTRLNPAGRDWMTVLFR
jgi:hypothetical protein